MRFLQRFKKRFTILFGFSCIFFVEKFRDLPVLGYPERYFPVDTSIRSELDSTHVDATSTVTVFVPLCAFAASGFAA
jgi:hypothetical protein